MEKELDRFGVDYSFFPAVDGNKLTREERWCYSLGRALALKGRPLTNEEIGCALSHVRVYEKMVAENIKELLILEDDCIFEDHFFEVLSCRESWLPSGWGLINFCMNHQKFIDAHREPLRDLGSSIPPLELIALRRHSQTACYLINLRDVQHRLDVAYPIRMGADELTGIASYSSLDAYTIFPYLVKIRRNLPSTTQLWSRSSREQQWELWKQWWLIRWAKIRYGPDVNIKSKEYFLQLLSKRCHDLMGKSVMPQRLSAEDTLAAYVKVNAGHGGEVTFPWDHRRGFGSNINSMMLVQLYCLVRKRQFKLDLSRLFPDITHRDFEVFAPFCVQSNLSGPTAYSGDLVWGHAQLHKLANELSTWHFYLPQLAIDGGIFHAESVIAKMVLQPTADIVGEHRVAMEDLKLYVAAHVRRGDKVTPGAFRVEAEAKKIEVPEYLRKIQDAAPGIRNIFVATDDYRVVSEFRELRPDLNVVSFCDKSRKGYFQSLKVDDRTKAWKEFAVDLYYLRNADHFVGTYSSNVGKLVALLREGENCSSLDSEWKPR